MNKAIKVRITRCYLIEIVDKDGNELACEYTFCNREDAKKTGERMIREYNEESPCR